MPDLLTPDQSRTREEIRAALLELDAALEALAAAPDERALLAEAVRGLDELFLIVVVGEFNAGKSALLNELLGARLLAEGVTPTTAAITLIRRGERESEEWRGPGLLERRLPSEALRSLAVVDTPGTNAIVRGHEELTREFVPRADLILVVTSADRPLTETERALIEAIREWGKKIVVVINKVDLLDTPAAAEQVRAFVRDGLRTTLEAEPPLFLTSVRLARLAAETTDPAVQRALASQSGLAELRGYVFGTLDEAERVRLKLSTPIGVGERLLDRYRRLLDERRQLVAGDRALVENVEGQLSAYAEDLDRGVAPRLAEIANVVHELRDRGERFFDETVRIGRVFDLLNADKVRGAFEREVVADTAARIDGLVAELVEWFVAAEAKLWRDVSGTIRQRQQAAPLEADPDFLATRRDVLRGVADRTRGALQGFDREQEARAFGQSMRDAVVHTGIAQIGALSLGAAIAVLFGTVAADVTGLLAATLAASLGLYILPMRKRRALAAFRKRTDELRERLVDALTTQTQREIAGSMERVREAIAPYTRYVRAEAARLDGQHGALEAVRERLGRLRAGLGAGAS